MLPNSCCAELIVPQRVNEELCVGAGGFITICPVTPPRLCCCPTAATEVISLETATKAQDALLCPSGQSAHQSPSPRKRCSQSTSSMKARAKTQRFKKQNRTFVPWNKSKRHKWKYRKICLWQMWPVQWRWNTLTELINQYSVTVKVIHLFFVPQGERFGQTFPCDTQRKHIRVWIQPVCNSARLHQPLC